MTGTYGNFTRESDGRLSGKRLYVSPMRRDGKFPVTHHFGSGKRINKLATREQVEQWIAELTKAAMADDKGV